MISIYLLNLKLHNQMNRIVLLILVSMYIFFMSCVHKDTDGDHSDHTHESGTSHQLEEDKGHGHEHEHEDEDEDEDEAEHNHAQEENDDQHDDRTNDHSHDYTHEDDHNHNHDQEIEQGNDHNHEHETDSEIEEAGDHDHETTSEIDNEKHNHYHVEKVTPGIFHQVIRTSGEILNYPGEEHSVVAQSDGIVQLSSSGIFPGRKVEAEDVMFYILPGELTGDNPQVQYEQASTNFKREQKNYERAKDLYAENIMSEKEFLKVEADYKNSRSVFKSIKKSFANGKGYVKAGSKGYIRTVLVKDGEFVSRGQKLATLFSEKRYVLKAELSQKYFSALDQIETGSFKPASTQKVISLDKLNGKKESFGKALESSSYYVPVYFSFDAVPGLLPGSYAEVYLYGKTIEEAITVPVTALLEEQGNYFVFVEMADAEYEKRRILTGRSDGHRVQVLSGLHIGEHVVTEDVYMLKLANLSGGLPTHSHAH